MLVLPVTNVEGILFLVACCILGYFNRNITKTSTRMIGFGVIALMVVIYYTQRIDPNCVSNLTSSLMTHFFELLTNSVTNL